MQVPALLPSWFDPEDCKLFDKDTWSEPLDLTKSSKFTSADNGKKYTSSDSKQGFIVSPASWPNDKKHTLVENRGHDAANWNLVRLQILKPGETENIASYWFWVDRHKGCIYRGVPYSWIRGGEVHTIDSSNK